MYKNCEYCGKEFTRRKSEIAKARFCSRKCKLLGFRPSIESRIQISNKLKGVKLSDERRKAISEGHKGQKAWNKGKHYKLPEFSEEHRKNIGLASARRKYSKEVNDKKGLKGDRHPLRKGGITNEPYGIDWNITLRRSIRERDHYACRLCSEQQGDYAFDIHHIDYNKKNCNPVNLITLCRSCHMKTNVNREYRIKDVFGKMI